MGLAYMRLGQAAQAEQAFQKAIDLSQSRYPEALFGLASLLSNHQRFSEAEPLARRGLELDGSSWYGQFERSEEHTSELQSPCNLVCRLLLEKKKKQNSQINND